MRLGAFWLQLQDLMPLGATLRTITSERRLGVVVVTAEGQILCKAEADTPIALMDLLTQQLEAIVETAALQPRG